MLKRLIESHATQPEYEHSVVSLTDIGEIGPTLIRSGTSVTALDIRSAIDVPRVLVRLTHTIRAAQPDIVQTWMYHADLLGGLAARLAGRPNVVWGIRTTDVSGGTSKATAAIRRVCASLSHVIPRVIVCAADASRRAHVSLGYDEHRMIVIPNGFDPERLAAQPNQRATMRQAAGFAEDDLVIGSLGRYNPDKDQANFVRAAGMLASMRPGFKFLMVGRDVDAGNSALMEAIEATGVAERFALFGERQDVPACLTAMDLFCLHSRTEGFPNVLGEAMTMGLPCVATDVGDARYLLGEAGIIVPARDPRALADALARLADLDADSRAALGLAAQQRILDNFTMSRASARFGQLYDDLHSSRSEY